MGGKDKTHDLVDFNIGEGFNNHKLILGGLPENLTVLRLSLNVPDCDWFTLGLMHFKALENE